MDFLPITCLLPHFHIPFEIFWIPRVNNLIEQGAQL